MTERPKIKESIKLKVRRDCLFGCVICGCPIFEYDHIEDYAIVKEHNPDNLVLLCPNHHAEKTKKILDSEFIKLKKQNPFNKQKERLGNYKINANKSIDVLIGNNSFSYDLDENFINCCIWINGSSYFNLKAIENWLMVSFAITNESGEIILYVEDGEIIFSKDIYDFKYVKNKISIATEKGKYIIELIFSNSLVNIINAKMIDKNSKDGILIDDEKIQIIKNGELTNNKISGCTYRNNGFGGIGILNQEKYPEVEKPRGFGMFKFI